MDTLPLELASARYKTLMRRPYYAPVLCTLRFHPRPGLGTIGVDKHYNCYYDPETILKWSVIQLSSVLEHEVGHLIRNHSGRASEDMDPYLWNVSGDFEINDDLRGVPDVEMPADCCYPDMAPLHFPTGLFAEEYYERLMQQAQHGTMSEPGVGQNGQGHVGHGQCGSCAGGEKQAHETEGDGGVTEIERELQRRDVAREILNTARTQGSVPAGWLRWAQQLMSPKVNWRSVIRSTVRGAVSRASDPSDYSYARPSRRDLGPDIVVPSPIAITPEIGIGVDTSGSMSDAMLGQALAEIDGAIRAVGGKVTVASVDCGVHTLQRNIDSIKQVQLLGGGGTDMSVAIRTLDALKPRPNLLVIVTDGYTGWPDTPPSTPMLLIKIANGSNPPWPCRIVDIAEHVK